MSTTLKVLTIIGSPHAKKSNTLAFANDFLDDVEAEGLQLTRQTIVLGEKNVQPCRGCWNCTVEKPCPLRDDDLDEIKRAMINCDMLVLGCPVYTNQVTAQMKALFDRLFTWCHIFPLLGKYSLSVTTTGNDGQREVGDFLEKMLATYGTSSFGTVVGAGAYTPGFFPRRETERAKNRKLATHVAATVRAGKLPKPTAWQRKMFRLMNRKMTGVQVVNFISNGPAENHPDPPKFMVRMIRAAMEKRNVPQEHVTRLSKLMSFELRWWMDRRWFGKKSIGQLAAEPLPEGFDLRSRLLGEAGA